MTQCKICGSHAFNLRAEGIDQGELCDRHYWQVVSIEKAERINELSAMLDHQRDEAMESERMYLAEFAKLRAELAQAKLYTPGRRAEAMPKTENGPCNYPYWRILEVTA